MMLLKFLLPCLLCVSELHAGQNKDSISVYLVKQRWHTGIVIRTSDIDTNAFPESRSFNRFRYIDAGWGDDEFYRYPGFDLELAVKALFMNTPSTIRIEGINFNIEKYIGYSDTGFEIRIGRASFDSLCSFISGTFIKNSIDLPVTIETRYEGRIAFYKARWNYNLFNTCNTWVAIGFRKAGLDIDSKVILAEQLFKEVEALPNSKRLK